MGPGKSALVVGRSLLVAGLLSLWGQVTNLLLNYDRSIWHVQFIDDRLNCLSGILWSFLPVCALLFVRTGHKNLSILTAVFAIPFVCSGFFLIFTQWHIKGLTEPPVVTQDIEVSGQHVIIKRWTFRGYDAIDVLAQRPFIPGMIWSSKLATMTDAFDAEGLPLADGRVRVRFQTFDHKYDPKLSEPVVEYSFPVSERR